MKNLILCIVTLISLSGLSVSAQVQVTGHIFAEVVEPVSIKAEYNNHTLLTNDNQTQNFGHFTVNDRNMTSCLLIDNKVLVSNESKQSFELQTKAENYSYSSNKVDLQFTSNQSNAKFQNKTFSGRMNIVVAYN